MSSQYKTDIDTNERKKALVKKVFKWSLMAIGAVLVVVGKAIEHICTDRPHKRHKVYVRHEDL